MIKIIRYNAVFVVKILPTCFVGLGC